MSNRIGILGGSGQVGIEMAQLARSRGASVSAPRSSDVDIADAAAVERWVAETPLDAVVNCAAYTAVDAAEADAARAFAVNAAGPEYLSKACAAARIPLVHLSTDYVFSGEKVEPYSEEDRPDPINVYGDSKWAGERAVLDCAGDALVLRVSWVFSTHGKNFVKSVLAGAVAGETLEVVADQLGGPCGAHAIADAVWSLIPKVRGTGPNLRHFEVAPHITRYEFAKVILQFACEERMIDTVPQMIAVSTTRKPGTACRPLNSRLVGARTRNDFGLPVHDWRIELRRVVSLLVRQMSDS